MARTQGSGKDTALFSLGEEWGLLNFKLYLQGSAGCWKGVDTERTQRQGCEVPMYDQGP